MNINRHNYEEYFILYADKELSSDERRMVEEFVSLNPDLKDELDIYTNAVLLPDTSFGFENKEELHHYDESLITYMDGELADDERTQLEKLINTSPKLKQELDLYKKTKLQPDTDIVFENKSVLYRSTERRRVVPMTIIRWSVAAAVLLAISVTAVNIFNKKSDETSTANADLQKNNLTKPESNKDIAIKDSVIEKTPVTPLQIKGSEQNNVAQTKKNPATDLNKKKASDIIKTQEKQNDVIAITNNQSPSNNLPARQNNPYLNSGNQKNDALVVKTNQKLTDAVTISDNDPYNTESQASNKKQSETEFASLTTIDNEEGNKNKKSRGLFRKITRVFEKNTGIKTTDDDEKLHIAAFTVKLK